MPTIREDLHGQVMGLASGGLIIYDPEHIGFDLKIKFSVDITDLCPRLSKKKKRGAKYVRLDYSISFKGEKYVLITKCRGKTDNRKYIYYSLTDLKKPDVAFITWAKDFGLTPKKLQAIIRRYTRRVK